MIRQTLILISSLLTLAATGCQTTPDVRQPTVTVDNIDVARSNLLNQRLLLTLRVTNPNNFEIPVDGLRADIELNDRPFAQGVSNYRTVLPRLGSTIIPLEATISLMDMLRQIMTLSNDRDFAYNIHGDLFVSNPEIGPVSFDKTGHLTLNP